MKKFFLPVMAIFMMGAFVACNSVESKAEKYAKELDEADKADDDAKYDQIEKEADEYYESLSDEDQDKFDDAMDKAEKALREKK